MTSFLTKDPKFSGGSCIISKELGDEIHRNSISHSEIMSASATSGDTVLVSTAGGDAHLRHLLAQGYQIAVHRGTMWLLTK